MRRALLANLVCLIAALASPVWPCLAEVEAQAPAELPVYVDTAGPVDPPALREALHADLGVSVTLAPLGRAQLLVDYDSAGNLRIRARLPGQPERVRIMSRMQDRGEATVAVALVAANLVRDESGALIALLTAAREAPVVVYAPEVAPTETAPRAVPSSGSVGRAEREPAPPPQRTTDIFGLDFVPGLGSSSAFGVEHRRHLSIGVIGALSGGVDGVALSGVVDIAVGDVYGLQLSSVLSIAGPVHGVQGGLVSISAGSFEGLQLGLVAITGDVAGAQIGLLDVAGGDVNGLQVGLLNIAGSVTGAQVGLLNIAGGRVSGAQVGLVNIAERSDASIGLLSVQALAQTHLRLFGDASGLLGTELVHGDVTQTIVSAAVQPFGLRPVAALGVGFGVRARFAEVLHLDVQLLGRILLDERTAQEDPEGLFGLHVLFGVALHELVGLYGGVGYEVRVSGREVPGFTGSLLPHELGSGVSVTGWPTLIAGIELF